MSKVGFAQSSPCSQPGLWPPFTFSYSTPSFSNSYPLKKTKITSWSFISETPSLIIKTWLCAMSFFLFPFYSGRGGTQGLRYARQALYHWAIHPQLKTAFKMTFYQGSHHTNSSTRMYNYKEKKNLIWDRVSCSHLSLISIHSWIQHVSTGIVI